MHVLVEQGSWVDGVDCLCTAPHSQQPTQGPRRFKPDKGFSGADYGKGGSGGPVQFEKGRDDVDEDVFGLNTLMEDVKAGAKRKGEGGDREDGKSRRR